MRLLGGGALERGVGVDDFSAGETLIFFLKSLLNASDMAGFVVRV